MDGGKMKRGASDTEWEDAAPPPPPAAADSSIEKEEEAPEEGGQVYEFLGTMGSDIHGMGGLGSGHEADLEVEIEWSLGGAGLLDSSGSSSISGRRSSEVEPVDSARALTEGGSERASPMGSPEATRDPPAGEKGEGGGEDPPPQASPEGRHPELPDGGSESGEKDAGGDELQASPSSGRAEVEESKFGGWGRKDPARSPSVDEDGNASLIGGLDEFSDLESRENSREDSREDSREEDVQAEATRGEEEQGGEGGEQASPRRTDPDVAATEDGGADADLGAEAGETEAAPAGGIVSVDLSDEVDSKEAAEQAGGAAPSPFEDEGREGKGEERQGDVDSKEASEQAGSAAPSPCEDEGGEGKGEEGQGDVDSKEAAEQAGSAAPSPFEDEGGEGKGEEGQGDEEMQAARAGEEEEFSDVDLGGGSQGGERGEEAEQERPAGVADEDSRGEETVEEVGAGDVGSEQGDKAWEATGEAEELSEAGLDEGAELHEQEQAPSSPPTVPVKVYQEEGGGDAAGEEETARLDDAEPALEVPVPQGFVGTDLQGDVTAEDLDGEAAVHEQWQAGGLQGTSMGGDADFSEIEVEVDGKTGSAGVVEKAHPSMGGPTDFSDLEVQDKQGNAGGKEKEAGQTFPMGGSTDFSDIDLQDDDKMGKGAARWQPSGKLPSDVIVDPGVHGFPEAGGGADFSNLDTVAEGEGVLPRGSLRAVVAASMIGNILEWYDFGVFAYFAPEIGSLFFPRTDAASGILSAFVVFGGAFFIRPLGGVLFGYVGDKYGRKVALYVSVLMMASSTFVMGCLPTYSQAGLLATFLLVMCRLMQGLSVGGELVGSMIFAVESSPPNRKCFIGSLCLVGAILGLVLGSLTGLMIHAAMSPEEISSFGWRIPFLLGVLIGGFALWIRSGLHESLEFEQSVHARRAAEVELQEARGEVDLHEEHGHVSNESKSLMVIPEKIPLFQSVKHHPVEVLSMLIVSGCFGIGIWVLTAFPPSLYQDLMQPPLGEQRGGRRSEGGAMFDKGHLNIWQMHTALCLVPCFSQALFGYLGDYVGNVRMMMIGCFSVAVLAIPCLYGMGVGTFASAAFGQGILLFAVGIIGGNLPTWMVTAFPIEVRFTAIAVGYNAGQAIFGGTASILATLIYRETKSTALIGLYHSIICTLALLSIIALQRLKRSKEDPLQGGLQEV